MSGMPGYNPDVSLLPSGGGTITPMSGGGTSDILQPYNHTTSLLLEEGGTIIPMKGGETDIQGTQGAINTTSSKSLILFSKQVTIENPNNKSSFDDLTSGQIDALESFGIEKDMVSFETAKEILQSLYDDGCNTDLPLSSSKGCKPLRQIVQQLAIQLYGKLSNTSSIVDKPVISSIIHKPTQKFISSNGNSYIINSKYIEDNTIKSFEYSGIMFYNNKSVLFAVPNIPGAVKYNIIGGKKEENDTPSQTAYKNFVYETGALSGDISMDLFNPTDGIGYENLLKDTTDNKYPIAWIYDNKYIIYLIDIDKSNNVSDTLKNKLININSTFKEWKKGTYGNSKIGSFTGDLKNKLLHNKSLKWVSFKDIIDTTKSSSLSPTLIQMLSDNGTILQFINSINNPSKDIKHIEEKEESIDINITQIIKFSFDKINYNVTIYVSYNNSSDKIKGLKISTVVINNTTNNINTNEYSLNINDCINYRDKINLPFKPYKITDINNIVTKDKGIIFSVKTDPISSQEGITLDIIFQKYIGSIIADYNEENDNILDGLITLCPISVYISKDINDLITLVALLQNKINTFTIRSKQETFDSINKLINDITPKKGLISTSITSYTSEKDTINSTLVTITKTFNDAITALAENNSEITTKNKEFTDKQAERDAINATLSTTSNDATKKTLQDKLSEYNTELDDLKTELDDLKVSKLNLTSSKNNAKVEVDNINYKLEINTKILEELNKYTDIDTILQDASEKYNTILVAKNKSGKKGATVINSGITGAQGATGMNSGTTGAQGATGINSGITGAQGATGINSGITGAQGATGMNSGITGAQGATGMNSGITGAQGIMSTKIGLKGIKKPEPIILPEKFDVHNLPTPPSDTPIIYPSIYILKTLKNEVVAYMVYTKKDNAPINYIPNNCLTLNEMQSDKSIKLFTYKITKLSDNYMMTVNIIDNNKIVMQGTSNFPVEKTFNVYTKKLWEATKLKECPINEEENNNTVSTNSSASISFSNLSESTGSTNSSASSGSTNSSIETESNKISIPETISTNNTNASIQSKTNTNKRIAASKIQSAYLNYKTRKNNAKEKGKEKEDNNWNKARKLAGKKAKEENNANNKIKQDNNLKQLNENKSKQLLDTLGSIKGKILRSKSLKGKLSQNNVNTLRKLNTNIKQLSYNKTLKRRPMSKNRFNKLNSALSTVRNKNRLQSYKLLTGGKRRRTQKK